MNQKALIVESSALFKKIIMEIMNDVGIECNYYSSAKAALESSYSEYTFIIVSRTLEDLSGEVFLKLFSLKHGLGNALTIMLTASDITEILLDVNKAGYKLVFNKKNLGSFQELIVRILNKRTLDLNANILYVEDSQSVADLVVTLFKKNNAKIKHVNNILDMKLNFQETDFDLVITDYYLKNNETGDDVISIIQDSDNIKKSCIPILVVSSEANDYIIKPYDTDELLVRSSNLIKNYRLLEQSKQQQKDLLKMALTDHLTGLYNRHSLYDVGPKYISNANRSETALSLLMIDLDHFKKVNDNYGHSVGDIVLKSISKVLMNSCRTEDIVARYGGEEFIMLLSNCDLNSAIQKAERLREYIENCKPHDLAVTASIGVSELIAGDNFESFFIRADKAVYQAMELGRNKVVTEHNNMVPDVSSYG